MMQVENGTAGTPKHNWHTLPSTDDNKPDLKTAHLTNTSPQTHSKIDHSCDKLDKPMVDVKCEDDVKPSTSGVKEEARPKNELIIDGFAILSFDKSDVAKMKFAMWKKRYDALQAQKAAECQPSTSKPKVFAPKPRKPKQKRAPSNPPSQNDTHNMTAITQHVPNGGIDTKKLPSQESSNISKDTGIVGASGQPSTLLKNGEPQKKMAKVDDRFMEERLNAERRAAAAAVAAASAASPNNRQQPMHNMLTTINTHQLSTFLTAQQRHMEQHQQRMQAQHNPNLKMLNARNVQVDQRRIEQQRQLETQKRLTNLSASRSDSDSQATKAIVQASSSLRTLGPNRWGTIHVEIARNIHNKCYPDRRGQTNTVHTTVPSVIMSNNSARNTQPSTSTSQHMSMANKLAQAQAEATLQQAFKIDAEQKYKQALVMQQMQLQQSRGIPSSQASQQQQLMNDQLLRHLMPQCQLPQTSLSNGLYSRPSTSAAQQQQQQNTPSNQMQSLAMAHVYADHLRQQQLMQQQQSQQRQQQILLESLMTNPSSVNTDVLARLLQPQQTPPVTTSQHQMQMLNQLVHYDLSQQAAERQMHQNNPFYQSALGSLGSTHSMGLSTSLAQEQPNHAHLVARQQQQQTLGSHQQPKSLMLRNHSAVSMGPSFAATLQQLARNGTIPAPSTTTHFNMPNSTPHLTMSSTSLSTSSANSQANIALLIAQMQQANQQGRQV